MNTAQADSHLHVLPAGHMLQSFRIDGVLGQGGFGVTYLAHDCNLDRQVAIKEFLPVALAVRESNFTVQARSSDHSDSFKWGRDRFLDEARMLATFDHPSIVRVLTFLEQHNTAYMVMRYEDGHALSEWVARRKFSEGELVDIAMALMDGLEVVHARAVTHRDIKPDNVFIRSDGQPLLLDFGSARQALGESTQHATAMVSKGFSAPEQYGTDGSLQGPWTDIYGLAATLYYCVVKERPMDAMDRNQRLLGGDESDPLGDALQASGFSAPFCRAVSDGLVFKPALRPQSVADWRTRFPALAASDRTWSAEFDTLSEVETYLAEPASLARASAGIDNTAGTATTEPVHFRLTRLQMVMASVIGLLMMTGSVVGAFVLLDYWRHRGDVSQVQAIGSFQDALAGGGSGPTMQVLPPGVYLMGAGLLETDAESDERPQHEEVIAVPFAIGQREVTVGQFAEFVAATGHTTDAERGDGCYHREASWRTEPSYSWRNPGFEQGDAHPVVCVSRDDASAYVDWLTEATGRRYRLPTEAEWEYAARAGTSAARYWGDLSKEACGYANVLDASSNVADDRVGFADCSDAHTFTAKVGRFGANAFDLVDMLGNAWEWTSACWTPSYIADAKSLECGGPVVRGGSWSSESRYLRAANRYEETRGYRSDIGFRVVAEVDLKREAEE